MGKARKTRSPTATAAPTTSELFITEAASSDDRGVHPTFTLHALTLRTADYMAKNWGGIAA